MRRKLALAAITAALSALALLMGGPANAQSPNLNCDHIPSNPVQGEVSANAATDCLDEATQEARGWTITGNTTVTQAQLAEGSVHVLGGSPSAFNFDLPASIERVFAVSNGTGVTATVQVVGGGGDSVAVADGETRWLHSDGTDVIALAPDAGVQTTVYPFTIGAFFGGTMEDNQLLMKYVFTQAITCPSGLTGSQLHAGTAATAETVIDVEKNGSDVGDITVAASGTTASFTMASAQSFSAGDRLSLAGPATADATLADTSITLTCTRD